jgi:hypothetical protein
MSELLYDNRNDNEVFCFLPQYIWQRRMTNVALIVVFPITVYLILSTEDLFSSGLGILAFLFFMIGCIGIVSRSRPWWIKGFQFYDDHLVLHGTNHRWEDFSKVVCDWKEEIMVFHLKDSEQTLTFFPGEIGNKQQLEEILRLKAKLEMKKEAEGG